MKRKITYLLLLILTLSSCHFRRTIDVYDSFETQKLSSIWGDWRFLPGAVMMQSDVVRAGKQAVRITLRPGDQMDDEKETILERAELAETRRLVSLEDVNYSYSFSMFLPRDFPITTVRLIIAQWKQYCKSGNCDPANPVIAMRYMYGRLSVECKTGMKKEILYEQAEEIRNKWLDFKFNIRFSRGRNGRIETWLNNKKIVDYTGATAYPEKYGYPLPNYFYFKMGLYRDRMPETMTVYIDEYRKQQYSE